MHCRVVSGHLILFHILARVALTLLYHGSYTRKLVGGFSFIFMCFLVYEFTMYLPIYVLDFVSFSLGHSMTTYIAIMRPTKEVLAR